MRRSLLVGVVVLLSMAAVGGAQGDSTATLSSARPDSAPRSTESATPQQKLVLSYFRDVVDGRKLDLIELMFHADCVIHRPEGRITGLADFRKFHERGLATFEKLETEVNDVVESGDRVAVRLSHRGRGAGVFRSRLGEYDIKGKSVTWDATVIFRLKDGKIAEEWVSRDELGMLLSAGLLEVRADDKYTKPTTPTYKTVGDLPLKADVYRLPGDDVRPALVWIHGGALIFGKRDGPSLDQRKRYLDAGYVIVSIDYHLAPETKLAGIIEDVQDAITWVRTKGPDLYRIDPRRVAVVGHSAGGYLALMAGFAVEPRPQALVAFYGYGDVDGDWYARPDPFYLKRPLVSAEDAYKAVGTKEIAEGDGKGRMDFYRYCRQTGQWPREVVGHDPATQPREFDRFCPVRNVTEGYPPTLLLHGDADTDVPHRQSVAMAAELERVGVEHALITIKGGGHVFDRKGMQDAEVSAAFGRIERFLAKHLGEESSVRQTVQRFYDTFNSHDWAKLAEFTTEDFTHINPGGGWTRGREAVLKLLKQAHSTFLKDVQDIPDADMTEVRFATANVAVVTVPSAVRGSFTTPDGKKHENERQIRTFVLVRRGGKWLIMQDQNTVRGG